MIDAHETLGQVAIAPCTHSHLSSDCPCVGARSNDQLELETELEEQ